MNHLTTFVVQRLDVYGDRVSRNIQFDSHNFGSIVGHLTRLNLIELTPALSEQVQKASTVFERTVALRAIQKAVSNPDVQTSLAKYMKTRDFVVLKLNRSVTPNVKDQPKTEAKRSTFYDYALWSVYAVVAIGGLFSLQPRMMEFSKQAVGPGYKMGTQAVTLHFNGTLDRLSKPYDSITEAELISQRLVNEGKVPTLGNIQMELVAKFQKEMKKKSPPPLNETSPEPETNQTRTGAPKSSPSKQPIFSDSDLAEMGSPKPGENKLDFMRRLRREQRATLSCRNPLPSKPKSGPSTQGTLSETDIAIQMASRKPDEHIVDYTGRLRKQREQQGCKVTLPSKPIGNAPTHYTDQNGNKCDLPADQIVAFRMFGLKLDCPS